MREEADPDPLGIGSSHYHNVPLAQRMDANAGYAGPARSSATAAAPAPPRLSMAFQPGYGHYYGYGYYGHGGHGWPVSPGPESAPVPDAAGSVRGRSSTYHVLGTTAAARPAASPPSARDLFYQEEEEAQQEQPDDEPPLNDDEAVRRRVLPHPLSKDATLTCSRRRPGPVPVAWRTPSARRRNGSRR